MAEDNSNKSGSWRTVGIIVFAVILFLIIIVVIYFIMYGNSKTPNKPIPLTPPTPTPTPTPTPNFQNIITSLPTGSNINQNQVIFDSTGTYYLVPQDDGNIVIYGETTGNYIWSGCYPSSTNCSSINWGVAPYQLRNQTDGNLVLYDKNGKAGWNSGTVGQTSNSVLTVTSKGVAQLTDVPSGKIIWSSK